MSDEHTGWPPPAESKTGPGWPPPSAWPSMPPEPSTYASPGPPAPRVEPVRPQLLHIIAGLLVLNLVLSIGVTIASLLLRNSLVDFQLDHRHITDPDLRATLRGTYSYTIVVRALSNVAVSIVYFFLVRALFRGRRWAYRRVIWLGGAGAVLLLVTLATPYPLWLHVEQVVQAANLAVMVYLVTRPPVRAFFASGLPGRDTRRFRKS